jgi:hypothetical protein
MIIIMVTVVFIVDNSVTLHLNLIGLIHFCPISSVIGNLTFDEWRYTVTWDWYRHGINSAPNVTSEYCTVHSLMINNYVQSSVISSSVSFTRFYRFISELFCLSANWIYNNLPSVHHYVSLLSYRNRPDSNLLGSIGQDQYAFNLAN